MDHVRAGIEALEPLGPAYGLTHGDMNCGNVIWDGERCTIIDFDAPMWNWFAADIVRPMRDYRFWPLEPRRRFLGAIVEGYRSIREFSDAWVEPAFLCSSASSSSTCTPGQPRASAFRSLIRGARRWRTTLRRRGGTF